MVMAAALPITPEGMPVREATFVVKEGRLVPFDDTTKLTNGSLDEWGKHGPAGWSVDEPGKISFRDEAVKHEGAASLRQEEVAAGDQHGRDPNRRRPPRDRAGSHHGAGTHHGDEEPQVPMGRLVAGHPRRGCACCQC